MGISKVVICDNCGTAKGQNNHWFMVYAAIASQKLEVHSFNLEIAEQFHMDILCGEACVHTWLSLNLSRISGVTAQLESRSDHSAATSAREPASLEQIHSVVNTVLDKWDAMSLGGSLEDDLPPF